MAGMATASDAAVATRASATPGATAERLPDPFVAMPMKYLFSDWIPPVTAAYVLVLLISAAVAIKSTASLRARTPERSHIDRTVFALIIVAGFVFLLRNTILDDVMVFRPG